uniref:Putative ribonuclease H-like domain-containing protein n=1 Tax=Tanacetum cinerariifolium TaxID=118510 RepID=A0A6L2M5M3_TANCI|nr:putative ribonuclease H-like domain-containing protein [Tanacetum cinerariifolium]
MIESVLHAIKYVAYDEPSKPVVNGSKEKPAKSANKASFKLKRKGRLQSTPSSTFISSNKLENIIWFIRCWDPVSCHEVYMITIGLGGLATGTTSDGMKGRTVAVTTEDMQKRRNDTFGGNEATKKTKKNLLKQQYGNFKAEASKTLEQTFNRLEIIVSQLEFMDIEIKQDDLNQKFLTSLAPEWLMHTIKKSESQNMAFISSSKNSSGNKEVNTASVPTASTQVSPAGANVAPASISLDTACAYITFQSNGSQIKYEDINQIDEDDNEEMDIKAPRSQDKGRRDNYRQGSKVEEQALKALMAIDGVGWDWSYMANEEENHALVADEEAPTEFALMAKSGTDNEVEARLVEFKNQEAKFCEKIRGLELKVEFKTETIEYLTNQLKSLKNEKEGLESKLTGFKSATKDLDHLIGSQRSDKIKEGLPEFADDTITNYTRPSPSVESNPNDLQNSSSSASENGESTGSILSKPEIKFVKPTNSLTVAKTDKKETVRKPTFKYAELYRKTTKRSNVRGNQRNWNNLKSHQLGKNFVMKKACYNCGGIDHLSYNCGKWVEHGRSWPKNNNTHKSRTPRTGNSQINIDDKGYWDSGCSRHMTGNISYLTDYEPYDGGTPRQHNMYTIDLNNVVPHKDLTCLVAKASADESMLWHRRLGHLNFKTMNRFTWTLFLKTKDETSGILRNFIIEIENLKELRVKIIRCNNGGEFRNKEMNDFCSRKSIKREFSKARTLQQNGVVERRNRTLIEVARTMLADAKLPVTFWAEAVNTACTKEAAGQDVKKDVSSLRYIALPNCGNSNPTATSINPPADHMETLAVETPIPTVSSPVPTACLDVSLEPSSDTRLISKRVTSQDDTSSLDNILTLTNRFEDILGVTTNTDDTNRVEADLGNREDNISASPTPTLRIHKDHSKTQINILFWKLDCRWSIKFREGLLGIKCTRHSHY